MKETTLTPLRLALVVALLMAAVLAGTMVTDRIVAGTDALQTGSAIGRASFAYLSGLRIFGAQVLWNRIEPIFHEFYGGVELSEQVYMLPTMNVVIALDPQFDQPYYVAPWIIARRGDTERALALSLLGVENNPRSGLLRSSYAQMLSIYGDDQALAVEQADIAAGPDMQWRDELEQHDSYGVLRFVYTAADETAKEQAVLAEIERLDALLGDALPAGSHDHDGNGVPDH